jgi:acyl-lipid omega-6 desaturase (Delta-12 desaturase)
MILQSAETERELRRRLRPMRTKKDALAVAIFAADAAIYATAVFGAMRSDGAAAWAWGTAAGIAIAMLFVVGHDACHGSLTGNARWNRWLGTMAFLPSMTPFSAWELGHNQTHHVYTNLKPLDYIWTPFSKREFDALPRWRRGLERVYRNVAGLGLYYGIEVWWKHLFFASKRRRDLRGSLLCGSYAVALSAVSWRIGWGAFAAGVIWPFVLWNWLMGWAIFEHHTHPDVPWFDDPAEWRAAQAQTRCTVHVELPAFADLLLHRIMQHTAHHLDVTVPLYGLANAQRALESEPACGIVVYRWSPLGLLRHLRLCKLYDFELRRWTGFDGVPR